MKKTKFLALVLVVAVVLMGAGYAAWTDAFKVDNTIETGELAVDLTCGAQAGAWVFEVAKNSYRLGLPIPDNIFVAPPQIDSESNKATFEFRRLFPGTKAYTQVKAKNNGSIPAVINGIKVDWETIDAGLDGVADLEKAMMVEYYFRIKNGQGIFVPGKEFTGTCALADLEQELNEKLRGEVLLPDFEITSWYDETGTVTDAFGFVIPHDALNGDEGENEALNVTIDFDFTQHNTFVE
jgi:predicted ribosomally synthesized peptide with SipW-like signal peptide